MMKSKIVIILLFLGFFEVKLAAQTAKEFLLSCVKDAHEKGAETVIVSANLCSACEGVYEGFIFVKEKSDYKLRYLKYFDGYEKVKILQEISLIDSNIEDIFRIESQHRDSIFKQISNLENLVVEVALKNGQPIFAQPISHGLVRFLGVFQKDASIYSIESITNLNELFEKAYFYWILDSSINNYKIDFFNSSSITRK